MILKDTILSAFTDRGTLLKWLKKVETALRDSILTDISIDQISETQVKFKFTFENGDFVESPVITLPRGEKGDKGDKGDTGATGASGVGFDNTSNIEQNTGTPTLTTETNGLKVGATFKITADGEVFEIPSTMRIPIKGSESVIIDVGEDGTTFNIHLDANIAAKLSHVLVTPESAPPATSIVAVDNTNAQTMLTVGDGLSAENRVLKVTKTQLYLHTIVTSNHTFYIVTNRADEYIISGGLAKNAFFDSIVRQKWIGSGGLRDQFMFGIAIGIDNGSGGITPYYDSPSAFQKGNALSYYNSDGTEVTILKSDFGSFVNDAVTPL